MKPPPVIVEWCVRPGDGSACGVDVTVTRTGEKHHYSLAEWRVLRGIAASGSPAAPVTPPSG